jgi:hypothetical protein
VALGTIIFGNPLKKRSDGLNPKSFAMTRKVKKAPKNCIHPI